VLLLLALAAAQAASSLPAIKSCDDYVGTVVQPLTFAAAEAKLKASPKLADSDQARGRSAELIIGKAVDPHYVTYDSGTGLLQVSLAAVDNLNVDYEDLFGYGTPYDGKIAFAQLDNIDVVISEGEAAYGSYIGSNSFGARRRVVQTVRVTNAIFDRAGEPDHADLFPSIGPDKILGDVALEAGLDEKQLQFSAAFVVLPKWPFITSGTKDWGAATIDDPQEVKQKITAIVATIRCGLLLDRSHKVIAAFRSR
jgi:hypothetical protein